MTHITQLMMMLPTLFLPRTLRLSALGLLLFLTSAEVGAVNPAVAAGYHFSLFLKSDGNVWAMGYNGAGQLGDGGDPYWFSIRKTPVQVMSDVQAISAGHYHSLFLKTDGTAWATGNNEEGELGDTTRTGRDTPVQVMSGVKAISAGNARSYFLKMDGSVWASGSNGDGGLGGVTASLDRPTPVQVMTGVRAISAGQGFCLFLKTDGSVWAAGTNFSGQLGDGTETDRRFPVQVMTGVQAISAGGEHSLFLKTDGSTWATGRNANGQLGNASFYTRYAPVQVMTGVNAISAGKKHSLFLKADGSVWAAGENYTDVDMGSSPVQVMTGARAISGGDSHSLFVMADDDSMWIAKKNGDTPLPVYSIHPDASIVWLGDQFGDDAGIPSVSGWGADPDYDGVANLLERAFNMPPLSAENPVMAVNGTAGLPKITEELQDGQRVLTMEYVRLTAANSGVVYTSQFGTDFGTWTDATAAENVTAVGTDWERVRVTDTVSGSDKRFGRVMVRTAK